MFLNDNGTKDNLCVLNFSGSVVTEDVPTLIPVTTYNSLIANDDDPVISTEMLEWPCRGTGGIYEKEFFDEYVNKLKDRPYPGSKRGHEWQSRPNTDFYTIGGKVTSDADGKSGKVFLKMYVPKHGDTTSNEGFIRDVKSKIVNYSLVTYPEYAIKVEDVNGEKREVRHFIGSKGGERNDAVEYGMGAMRQTVNKSDGDDNLLFEANADGETVSRFCYRWANRKIREGKYEAHKGFQWGEEDYKTALGPEGDDWHNVGKHFLCRNDNATEETRERYLYPIGKGGKVYRSALTALKAKATGETKAACENLIKKLDDKRKKSLNGGNGMELAELLATLKTHVANGQVSLAQIAEGVGLANLVRNETDTENAKIAAMLNGRRMEDILAENKAHAEAIVETKVLALVGNKTLKMGDGTEKENPAYVYVRNAAAGKSGDELDKALGAMKTDPVFASLNKALADGESAINKVIDGKANNATGQPNAVMTY